MSERTFSVSRKRVVVMGAASSGIAAAELLAERGARVTLSEAKDRLSPRDQRDPHALAESLARRGVHVELGGHVPETIAQADLIVLSPGVPRNHPILTPARQRGVPIIGEIELAYRWLRGRVVAITGTKGKSTTTTLAGRMLAAGGLKTAVGGNVGVPLSSQVESSTPETLHIVEVSSFQLETIDRFHPWIAVLLNFSPDHLDRHASIEEYAAAKARVFLNQGPDDWAVINADDPQTLEIARRAQARRFAFAMSGRVSEGVILTDRAIVHRTTRGEEPLVPLSSIRLTGRHLVADVMAAAAVARIVGVPSRAMTEAVETFTGLEHAMEPAGEIRGVRFVNDSKATAIAAVRQAIDNLDGPLVVILGGRFKGGRWEDLAAPLGDKAAAIVAIGESRPLIRQALEGVTTILEAETMREAVRRAFDAARPGHTVLLAPACSSFDMFSDYAERGRVFKEEVVKLRADLER